MTKFGDTTMKVTLSNNAAKIQTFKPLTLEAWNFQDRQVKKKKFLTSFWGTKIKRSFSNKNAKIQL